MSSSISGEGLFGEAVFGPVAGAPTSPPGSPPSAPVLSQVAGGSLAGRTEFVTITYVTADGETTASVEASLAVSANNLLSVASPASATGVTGWNAYLSTTSGAETKQNVSAILIGTDWTEPTTGLTSSGPVAPTVNTALPTPGEAAQNVRYRQIRREDREGDGKQFQMSGPDNPATEAYPALYDATRNVIARQPRGNTTVVQLADQTAGFIAGDIFISDEFGNTKDGGIQIGDVLTSPGGGIGATVGGLGSPYEQIPVGSKDGVNTSFFLDYIPASPPTGTPPVVPFWLFINGSGQSPYTPRYSLAPGSNHLVMAVAPKSTDEFWCVYFRGDIAPPPSPIASAMLTMVYTYVHSGTTDGFVKLQVGTTLPLLYDNTAYTNRTFTSLLSPLPPGFGSGLWTVSLEVYGSIFQDGTDVLQLFEIYADVTYADATTGRIYPTATAYAGTAGGGIHFDATHATGDGTTVTYTVGFPDNNPPSDLTPGMLLHTIDFPTAGFNVIAAVITGVSLTVTSPPPSFGSGYFVTGTITIANPTIGNEDWPATEQNASASHADYYGSVADLANALDGNLSTYATLTRDHYYPTRGGGGVNFTF